MTRSLQLATLALLMGAGVVLAAPAVTTHDNPQLVAGRSAPAAKRSDFVLHVDSKSRCVWRVSTVDGKRQGDRLPCAKGAKQAASRKVATGQD